MKKLSEISLYANNIFSSNYGFKTTLKRNKIITLEQLFDEEVMAKVMEE